MSQRTGNIIIVVIFILLNLLVLGGGYGGRAHDYNEIQADYEP